MQDFILQEKQRLQAKCDAFRDAGTTICVLALKGEALGPAVLQTTISNLFVTRVQPIFDSQGKHQKTEFWVMWNEPGYTEGFHCTHTVHVREHSDLDPLNWIWLGEDFRFWLRKLTPDETPDDDKYVQTIEDWRAYQAENPDLFARVDAQLLAEHQRIADTWPS